VTRPGPRPKPAALRLLHGDTGHRAKRNEPQPRPIRPECPAWLLPEAKVEWQRVAPELDALGLLTVVDMAALAAYAQAYARWQAAERSLAAQGATLTARSGYEYPRAEVAIARAERRAMLAAASEFGFSPASRTSIHVQEPHGLDDSLLDSALPGERSGS